MIWIIRIVLLGIVIGIARKYPRTSILLAIICLFIYANSDSEYILETKTNNIESLQSTNYPEHNNFITNYRPTSLEYSSNTNYIFTTPTKSDAQTKSRTIQIRVGAVCRDGTTSNATGRGACSHHGGVAYWLYE